MMLEVRLPDTPSLLLCCGRIQAANIFQVDVDLTQTAVVLWAQTATAIESNRDQKHVCSQVGLTLTRTLSWRRRCFRGQQNKKRAVARLKIHLNYTEGCQIYNWNHLQFTIFYSYQSVICHCCFDLFIQLFFLCCCFFRLKLSQSQMVSIMAQLCTQPSVAKLSTGA